jgi:predicted TPR repeat methyltransferase
VSRKDRRKQKDRRPAASSRAADEAAVRSAIDLHRQGRVEEAAKVYEMVLARSPRHVDALHFLGVAEHMRGRTERALGLLEHAAELAPTHPDIHSNYGNVLKSAGRLDDAEASYQRALALRPDDANATNNLGTVQRARGQLEEAAATFRKVIARYPEHADAHQNLGNVLGSLNRFEEALDAHREALRLRPRAGASYKYLGGMFYALGRIEEAADIYRQWQRIEPSNPMPAHLIAGCTGQDVPARASDDFVRRAFDDFAASFDQSLARLGYRAPALVAEAVGEVALGSERLDVLDAGCGTGLMGPLLRERAQTLTGVDLSPKMLERARETRHYDSLVEGELTAFLRDHHESYDLVVSADTLVYFGSLDEVARAAASCLRPGGHLAFTVERSEESDAPEGFRIHPHGRYSHTEPYLRRVLAGAGFEVSILRPAELRKEAGKWVNGVVAAARRPERAAGRS